MKENAILLPLVNRKFWEFFAATTCEIVYLSTDVAPDRKVSPYQL